MFAYKSRLVCVPSLHTHLCIIEYGTTCMHIYKYSMIMWRWTVMLQTALNQLSGGASEGTRDIHVLPVRSSLDGLYLAEIMNHVRVWISASII